MPYLSGPSVGKGDEETRCYKGSLVTTKAVVERIISQTFNKITPKVVLQLSQGDVKRHPKLFLHYERNNPGLIPPAYFHGQ